MIIHICQNKFIKPQQKRWYWKCLKLQATYEGGYNPVSLLNVYVCVLGLDNIMIYISRQKSRSIIHFLNGFYHQSCKGVVVTWLMAAPGLHSVHTASTNNRDGRWRHKIPPNNPRQQNKTGWNKDEQLLLLVHNLSTENRNVWLKDLMTTFTCTSTGQDLRKDISFFSLNSSTGKKGVLRYVVTFFRHFSITFTEIVSYLNIHIIIEIWNYPYCDTTQCKSWR